jgi:16S rRNA (guanine1516-N2)-methyltransferase
MDVSNTVDVTEPGDVAAAVRRILEARYALFDFTPVDTLVADLSRLYRGDYPGFSACDIGYHNLQHVLDVTLAMSRLVDGHDWIEADGARLGPELALAGIAAALFHDSGYIRRARDTRHKNGAAYTRVHVSRSARFLEEYLPAAGMSQLAGVCTRIVHFTGYELTPSEIVVASPQERRLGELLGTADLIAQMADVDYARKCREHLFEEFRVGGLAGEHASQYPGATVFRSPEHLLHPPQLSDTRGGTGTEHAPRPALSKAARLALLIAPGVDASEASRLVTRLNLPLLDAATDPATCLDYDALLVASADGLSLQRTGRAAPGPVSVDFGSARMRHRRGAGHNELLGRAVGVGKKPVLRVLDATAGLGRDSFVLADLGCQVLMSERARSSGDPWLQEASGRMSLWEGEARDLPANRLSDIDVVYLDPMFPERGKSAAVKKEMALFQSLLEGSGRDADQLLLWALDGREAPSQGRESGGTAALPCDHRQVRAL